MTTRKTRKHKNARTPMTDPPVILIAGIMPSSAYGVAYESLRRIYATTGLSPTCTTNGGGKHEIKILIEYN